MSIRTLRQLSALILAIGCTTSLTAIADDDSFAPGGTAIDQSTQPYHDLKAVMDLKVRNPSDVAFGYVTAKRIIAQPGAKLVVIIEGPAIAVFAKKNYLDHQGIVDNWAELADAGVQIEYCGNSVHGFGFKPSDMDGLSKSNPAVVNIGAFPSIAHYEQQGYGLIMPAQLEKPPL